MKKLKVVVLFGGRSPEHEVSIITGIQVMNALDKDKYEVVPVYITKEGKWFLGDKSFFKPEAFKNLEKAVANKKTVILSTDPTIKGLISESRGLSLTKSFPVEKVDVVFPTFHGRYGEDGAIQGLFELSNIPYVGCDVQASAIGMDKAVSKKIARSIDVPVLPDVWILSSSWKINKNKVLKSIKSKLRFPVFVKPARLGSSIGITKAHNLKELKEALDVAVFYDTKVVVEESLEGAKEVNISVLGNNPYELSGCEMPVFSGETLSFEDKYITEGKTSKGMASAKRLIPAPIKNSTKRKIGNYAKRFFAEIGGQGIVRVDFLVSKDEQKIYFNEINTMPGSVAFYLWKEKKISFDKLVDKLIELAIERSEEKKSLITIFKSNILAGFSGTKGIKS